MTRIAVLGAFRGLLGVRKYQHHGKLNGKWDQINVGA